MKTDTASFLEALLWAYPENDEGENPMEGRTVHEFTQEFTAAVDSFTDGFRDYLADRDIEIPETERSFGGNVYFSLSGHGCGFWDDEETEHLQAHLDAYSGNHYRFENIDLMDNDTGLLDLAILPEFIESARREMFTPETLKP